MTSKLHDVTVGHHRYQLRKMSPILGSYIWQQLMAAGMKAAEGRELPESDGKPDERSPEARLRSICTIAFMHMDFQTYQFIQSSSLKLVSRYENELPMPIMADSGQWVAKDIEDSPMLTTQLVVEILAFNLSSFLA